MNLNQLIQILKQKKEELETKGILADNVEISITDGYNSIVYVSSNEKSFAFEDFTENQKVFLDIGIGGCELEE